MSVRRVDELLAYQLSLEFKKSVYELVRRCPAAGRDVRYRDQLFASASAIAANITEGFGRRSAREFRQYLSYARGSAAEATTWLEDGVERRHFPAESIAEALTLARRTAFMIARLQRSLAPFID